MASRFLKLAGFALALVAAQAAAQAFPVPGKPVRVLIGFAAGGSTDIQARIVQPKLAEALGVPVVIENKPGASTMLAAQEVARAAPDGHTILYSFSGAFTQNPHTLANVPYDPFKDFTPISVGARGPQLLVAHVSLPASNVKELVAWGKANPGKLNIASFGVGTSAHIFAEMLMRQSGVEMVHVPYKGAGDATKDLITGRVQLMFDAAPSALQNVNNGKVKILGMVGEKRSRLLPGVPTLAEQGLRGIDIVGWLGYFGPAKLPPEIVQKLNAAIARALAHPEVKEAFDKGAYEAASSAPAELAGLVKSDFERWGKLVKELGLKPQ
jgi:tripartite-type tricarboxylate transporter receptor subunit TctC